MIIYCNGCSHTQGTELSTPDYKQTWPHVLGDLLNAKVLNGSLAGSSNDKIWKSSISDILRGNLTPNLAIIQWTHPERFDTAPGVSDPPTNLNWKIHYPFKPVATLANRATDFTIYDEFYTEHFNRKSEKASIFYNEKMLFQMYSLQTFFDSKNIPYVFIVWSTFQRGNELPKLSVVGQSLLENIDHSRILNLWYVSMYSILESKGFQRVNIKRADGTVDNHFGPDAHEYLSSCLFNFIRDGSILHTEELKEASDRFVDDIYDT